MLRRTYGGRYTTLGSTLILLFIICNILAGLPPGPQLQARGQPKRQAATQRQCATPTGSPGRQRQVEKVVHADELGVRLRCAKSKMARYLEKGDLCRLRHISLPSDMTRAERHKSMFSDICRLGRPRKGVVGCGPSAAGSRHVRCRVGVVCGSWPPARRGAAPRAGASSAPRARSPAAARSGGW